MDSTAALTIQCRCRVCDGNFDWVRRPGNHTVVKLICPKCFQWHRWCGTCKRGRLTSEFDRNCKNWTGVQEYCRDCQTSRRGGIKIRHCMGCQADFVAANSSRFNGRNVWLCHQCMTTKKHCQKCGTIKPLAEFPKAADKRTGRAAWCRSCGSDTWKALPASERARRNLGLYKLTWDQYQQMVEQQSGCCAICGSEETDPHTAADRSKVRRLAVDHDHATGIVRQLLCGRCNKAIGLLRDDPEIARAAAAYLARHKPA